MMDKVEPRANSPTPDVVDSVLFQDPIECICELCGCIIEVTRIDFLLERA
jgi:hypothetical protein